MNETNIETSSVWPTICQSLLFLNFSLGLCATIMNGFVAQTLIVKHGIVSSADYFVLGLSFSDFITGVGLVFSLANILEIDHFGRTWCLFQVIRREVVYFIHALIILPVIIVVILYLQIFKVAKHHIHIIAMARGKQSHVPRNRYIKMLFLMAGLYFIFYIPAGKKQPFLVLLESPGSLIYYKQLRPWEMHEVLATVSVIVPAVDFNWGILANMSDSKRRSILHMSALLFLCNSIANPIIYAFKIDTVKDRVKRMLGYPIANRHGFSDTFPSKSKQKQFRRYTSKVSIEAPLSFLPDHEGSKLSFTLAEIPEGQSIKETRKALYEARRKAIKESKKLNIVYSSQLNQEFMVKGP